MQLSQHFSLHDRISSVKQVLFHIVLPRTYLLATFFDASNAANFSPKWPRISCRLHVLFMPRKTSIR